MIIYDGKIVTFMDNMTYSMYTVKVDSIDYVCTAGNVNPHIGIGQNIFYVTADEAKTIEDLMIKRNRL